MTIVHLSYTHVSDCNDPKEWLKRISFFTGIVTCLARENEVHSLHCINAFARLQHNGVTYHFFKLLWFQRLFPFALHRHVKTLKPHVVIVHSLLFPWQVLWLRLQLGTAVKIFVQHHAEKPARYHKKFFQRLADKIITGYFFSSSDLGKKWIESGQIQTAEKIHEVMEVSSPFHPVDSTLAKQKLKVNGKPVYLWVGRLDDNKDPETLLKAFIDFSNTNRSAQLYMIFQTQERLSTVNELSKKSSSQITLIGKVKHDELLYWYNAADFIISTSHYEGSGLAVCEAMACGCIPILTDIPSFNTMTSNGHVGVLFKAGEVPSLKKALSKSLSLQIPMEKKRVLKQFDDHLSFQAISDKIYSVVSK